MAEIELPVRVLKGPHWRVNIRPDEYIAERVVTLKDCFDLIDQNRVRFRGWDFPHMRKDRSQCTQGTNWVGCWSDFLGHIEYWRFYQSGQFLHLASIDELEEGWRAKLEKNTRQHLSFMKDVDWSQIPGFLDIQNVIYTLTEVFEFAARLAQRGIYGGPITLHVTIRSIKGFVLTTDWNRAWHSYYASTEDQLDRVIEIETKDLIADAGGEALRVVAWFFERFGWHDPPLEIFKNDQQLFLAGRA